MTETKNYQPIPKSATTLTHKPSENNTPKMTLTPHFIRLHLPRNPLTSQHTMGRLQDKVALVTGSSSGLGRSIATRYAQEGAKVVCADITPTARSQIPEELQITTHDAITQAGGQAIFIATDVGDAKAVGDAVQAAVTEFGRLDM